MLVISDKLLSDGKFEPIQRFFLDCLFGLTHENSLDSYRVKCLNARTIVRELSEELEIGRLNDPEFKHLCSECTSILEKDFVVQSSFKNGYAALKRLLDDPPLLPGGDKKPDKKDEATNKTKIRKTRFAASDFLADLNYKYFDRLVEALKEAVKNSQEDEVASLTNAIVSDLCDRGWSLETLFGWHKHFIAQSAKPFDDNLDFMLRHLSHKPTEFTVTLKVVGGNKIRELSKFRHFSISEDVEAAGATGPEKKFLAKSKMATFVTGNFQDVDFVVAARAARAELETLIDLIRFEYERASLKIEGRSYVQRKDDGQARLVDLQPIVPNPIAKVRQNHFRGFVKNFGKIVSDSGVSPDSASRIRAAFRLYRFGRDSESYNDKFMNWWMGLESIAGMGGHRIGETVTKNVGHAMLVEYFNRLLRDLISTLRYVDLDWTQNLKDVSGVETPKELRDKGLVALLQSSAHARELWTKLDMHPYVVHHGKQLEALLNDPKMAAEKLQSHFDRVQWHLDRLYRIRCCIVHGATVRFRLPLYSANLEYYLTRCLILIIRGFRAHKHIKDLRDLFERADISWRNVHASLNDGNADNSTIAQYVASGIVPRD